MDRRTFLERTAKFFLFAGAPSIASAQLIGGAPWRRNPYWHAMSTTGAPSAREDSGFVWTGSKLLIWGGQLPGSTTILGDGYIYDPSANTWTTMSTTNAPAARVGHSAVWDGTYMIVWGGASNSNLHTALATGAFYNPANDTWTTMGGTPPSKRCYHGAVMTANGMLVWGGYDFSTSDKNDGFFFTAGTNTWSSAIQTTNAPVARDTFCFCAVGTKVVAFGGENFSAAALNSGAIYDVPGNTWTTISATGAPPARECWRNYATDGSKLFITGGDDTSSAVSGSYILDPVANTWTTCSTTNAPSARTYPAVVWNGKQYMIFGGATKAKISGTDYNDLYFYDPVADKWWTAVAGGVPSVRDDVVYALNGTKLIIQGGQNAARSGGFTDGAIFY